MSALYGLIGYPLTHSFSRKYFTEKFLREGIPDTDYRLFEIPNAEEFPGLFEQFATLKGLNVTIPHKKAVLPLLQRVDSSAERVGAVNVIKKEADGSLTGYNSDYVGFLRSLRQWMGPALKDCKALVLGTGGAASAVKVALEDLDVRFQVVSRSKSAGMLTYRQLAENPEILNNHLLIVNTSPVGTYPKTDECPDLPYSHISANHFLYDLVYNPEETLFMKKGLEKGARVKNGYDMLVLQAEGAWEIWNQKS